MEYVPVAVVYFVVFLGVFVFYGIPWLWRTIFLPVLQLLDELLDVSWQGVKKLVNGIISVLASGVVIAGCGVQRLWREVIRPLLVLLAGGLKTLWREFYFWSIGDADQE